MWPTSKEAELDEHLSSVLDALAKGDKETLKQLGQRRGFFSNRIRKLVWYYTSHLLSTYTWPVLLDCLHCGCGLHQPGKADFPGMDETDKITLGQDVRRAFTRYSGSCKVNPCQY